jgi:hypothetical protein
LNFGFVHIADYMREILAGELEQGPALKIPPMVDYLCKILDYFEECFGKDLGHLALGIYFEFANSMDD